MTKNSKKKLFTLRINPSLLNKLKKYKKKTGKTISFQLTEGAKKYHKEKDRRNR